MTEQEVQQSARPSENRKTFVSIAGSIPLMRIGVNHTIAKLETCLDINHKLTPDEAGDQLKLQVDNLVVELTKLFVNASADDLREALITQVAREMLLQADRMMATAYATILKSPNKGETLAYIKMQMQSELKAKEIEEMMEKEDAANVKPNP